MNKKNTLKAMVLSLSLLTVSPGHAFIVTDLTNLIQNLVTAIETGATVSEVASLLSQAQKQYSLLNKEYKSFTGKRFFSSLLNDIAQQQARKYIPPEYRRIIEAIRKKNIPGGMAILKRAIDEYEKANSDYDPGIIFSDPATESAKRYKAYYENNSAYHGLATASFDSTDKRIDNANTFIEKIDEAEDMKASTDLGNRINSENTLLLTEQIRLQAATLKKMNDNDQDEMRRRANDHRIVNTESGGMFNSKTAAAFLAARGIHK